MIMHAGDPPVGIDLDPADHREVADLGAGRDRARDPGDQRALLGVGRAAGDAEAAIDAGMRQPARRRQRRQRRLGPVDAHRLAASASAQRRGVQLVRAIGIARTLRPPGIVDRPGDLQRLLDLGVVVPHLAPIERPVRAVAEQAARLEPFRAEAQRHHGEMHGAAADRLAAVVAAQLQRVVAVDDALVGPVELGLLGFVGGEILQRPELRAGIERHDREALLRPACRRACRRRRRCRRSAKSTASSSRYSRIGTQPPGRNTSGARPPWPRGASGSAMGGSSDMAVLSARRVSIGVGSAVLRRLPTDRARRSPSGHSRAGWPDRPSRSRSRPSGGRNRPGRCRAIAAA